MRIRRSVQRVLSLACCMFPDPSRVTRLMPPTDVRLVARLLPLRQPSTARPVPHAQTTAVFQPISACLARHRPISIRPVFSAGPLQRRQVPSTDACSAVQPTDGARSIIESLAEGFLPGTDQITRRRSAKENGKAVGLAIVLLMKTPAVSEASGRLQLSVAH